ncbi:MAG: Cupin region [Berkelbacteria bacterium GW2011_GWA2_35_9]|uniref:Cupin region n=1 Tax=Berkelbacteria bacterium GW2011_GWA2_35_9 TaxID=1618333 RepID=A0A0G0FP59_9BACT|nr:MAG: Cupin region [Berkelbacteria bacterium GW2011_GWA2_35_9]
MNTYIGNIEKETLENNNFQKVLFTAKHSQLVVMSLKAGEDIGSEVHQLDQFIRVDKGTGKTVLDGKETEISDGFAVVVPSGVEHNIINTGTDEMKLYTVYSPPNHKDGTVHKTKEIAESGEEHFDGQTSL